MADDTTRIINLTEATEIADGMYLVTDASTGTRKLALQKVIDKAGVNVADEYSSSSTYDVGDLCVYNGVLYECTTAITTAEAWDSDHWKQVNLGDIITDMDGAIDDLDENKADKNGEYDYLTVGLAKQLKSSVMQLDSQPFNFRTTGGSSDVGDREYLEMVGASAVVNQLLQNSSGASATQQYYGMFSNEAVNIQKGHKYLVQFIQPAGCKIYIQSLTHLKISAQEYISAPASNTVITRLLYGDETGSDNVSNLVAKNETTETAYQLTGCMLVDLTAYFGSNTIPDYIYSLEQGQAGAGITWIRNNCPKLLEYHAYSVPTMKHVSGVTGYETTGVNQWDEEWEVGTYDSEGNKLERNDQIRSKNFIRVLPNTTYYYKSITAAGNSTKFYYNANKEFISSEVTNRNATFTTPANAYYMNFIEGLSYGTTYNHDICINLHWSGEMDGTYHPYEKHTYDISGDVTLRGIYKLDANNQLVTDGDVRTAEGSKQNNYAEIDLGDLEWTRIQIGTDYAFGATISGKANGKYNYICEKYMVAITDLPDKSTVGNANSSSIYIRDDSYTDAAAFTTAVTGQKLVYELATPTTSTAPSFQSPMICNDWGTEEFLGTVEIPVGCNIRYPQNLRDKLQHLPDMAESDGDYIIRQDGTSMALVPLPEELPPLPQNDGTYKLSLTISSGEATLSWESES